jgi:hypothetical protein
MLPDVPKHLARFEFVPTGSRTSTFKAFLPDEERPFFTATVTDSYFPGVPLPAFLPNPFMRFVQPPLAGASTDESNDDWLRDSQLSWPLASGVHSASRGWT